jgi:hypothetical protein
LIWRPGIGEARGKLVSELPRERFSRFIRTTVIMVLACMGLSGCFNFGSTRLYEDQIGYSRALGDAEKSETLLNIVRMRYADTPTFLQATQVISGYQLQRNVSSSFQTFSPSNFLGGSASTQLQQNPTFTFQPLSGEEFAQSFIRPLSSADLLPFAMSGLPIDVLFRLGVQSANGLSNAVALTEIGAAGSPDFFLLLHDLRRLQIAGLLTIRFEHNPGALGAQVKSNAAGKSDPKAKPEPNNKPDPGHVYLSIATSSNPDFQPVVDETKRLLGVRSAASQVEVVYGRSPGPDQVAILTRSMLGVLSQLAIQVDVPPDDVAQHRTLPTVGNIGPEHRPVVIIHSGAQAPEHVLTSVQYGQTWFWIAEDDFDSKLAFTVLENLLALARTEAKPGAILTIPAG